MKKIIMTTLSLILIATFTSSAQKVSSTLEGKRPWWSTALIDACGAGLGGMQGAGLGPVGIIGGGILGGVGASLAANRNAGGVGTIGTPVYNSTFDLPTNSTFNSDINQAGILHNQIISDYYLIYPQFSVDTYWDFMSKNHLKYGVENLAISKEQLKVIITQSNSTLPNTTQELVVYLESRIPANLEGKADFILSMKNLADSKSLIDFNNRVVSIENTTLSNRARPLPVNVFNIYSLIYSIFTGSANFWK